MHTFIERRKKALAFALAVFVFVELTYLNLTRYWGLAMPTGDLAVMTQAIWSASHGAPLVYTVKTGIVSSRLLGHAEVIYFLLVPFLKLFPSAATLLVLETAIFVSAAVPVFRLGEKFGGHGLWAVAFYLFYPVAQTAVLMEFHSDPLAMAFLLWAFDEMERRRWGWFGFWALLVLLCKVYMAVPVMLLGIFLWARGDRKAAFATWIAAVMVGLILSVGVKVWLAPRFHTTGERAIRWYVAYRYADFFTSLRQTWWLRLEHGAIALLPFLPLLPVTGLLYLLPVVVLLLPIITTRINTYHYFYHHYAILVPFVLYASLDAIYRLEKRKHLLGVFLRWASALLAIFAQIVLVMLFWFVLAVPSHPFMWGKPVRHGRILVRWADGIIPRDAALLASGDMVSFFAMRPWVAEPFWSDVSLIDDKVEQAKFVLLDLFQEGALYFSPQNPRKILGKVLYGDEPWEALGLYDGAIVLKRSATTPRLPWSLERKRGWSKAECNNGFIFSPSLRSTSPAQLLCARFWEDGSNTRLLHAEFVWRVVNPTAFGDSMPITTVGDWIPYGERFPHFPIWAYTLSHRVEAGDVFIEQMTWEVHEPTGCYPVRTGWYSPNPAVYPITNDANLLGERWKLGDLRVSERGIELVETCRTH